MKVQEFFDVQAVFFNIYGLEDCTRKQRKFKYSTVLAPHDKNYK
jgi:hypothetical protein